MKIKVEGNKPVRVLVTGSREWDDKARMERVLKRVWNDLFKYDPILVHGDARGADRMAAALWESWGGETDPHPADWDGPWGKAAGIRRNEVMVNLQPNICIAFIKNESRGATHCATFAKRRHIPTIIFRDQD